MARSLKRKIAIGVAIGIAVLLISLWLIKLDFDSKHPCGTGWITCRIPVNEFIIGIQKAESGSAVQTCAMCMKPGEVFTSKSLTDKIGNLQTVTFTCAGSAICKNKKPIDVSSGNMIVANSDAKFRALITCTRLQDSSGNYDCTISITSA